MRRKTRRELFLDEMEQLLPWIRLESKTKCYYRYYAKCKTDRQTTISAECDAAYLLSLAILQYVRSHDRRFPV
jgi:hypothetical protein